MQHWQDLCRRQSYGNLCEYRLTGTAGSSHDLVCMGLLSERRLDMEKLYTPCSGMPYALSYYNAYGWILCSFSSSVLQYYSAEKKLFTESSFPFQQRSSDRSSYLVLCGWWFIRNAVLYNGDFLGRKSCAECAEKYAQNDYRPSLYRLLQSWDGTEDIILYQDPGWYHNWILTVCSFIGTFDRWKFICHIQSANCICCSLLLGSSVYFCKRDI